MTTQTPDRIDRITHDTAEEVGLAADDQLLDLLRRLDDAHWSAQTDCDRWDVAAMVGHLIGAAKGHLSMREMLRQQFHGLRHAGEYDGNALDACNELQVAEHAHLSPTDRVEVLEGIIRPATSKRTRMNGLLRLAPIPLDVGKGSMMAGMPRFITMGHLMDVIYTRDVWLHTVDIERATGVKADRSGSIDRIMVHDAVAEWLQRHDQPVRLHLTGHAGGSFTQGNAGEEITMDAIQWARTVSGRETGEGLLAVPVLF